MTKPVTSGQLRDTLSGLGFVADPGGGHVIFRRPGAGLVVSVPNAGREGSPDLRRHGRPPDRQFRHRTEAAFEARLAKAARNGHLQMVQAAGRGVFRSLADGVSAAIPECSAFLRFGPGAG
jgi:hypothetical protein